MADKTCIICGASCDGQPRTKDPQGRYYHKSCHAQAMLGKDGATSSTAPFSAGEDDAGFLSEFLTTDAGTAPVLADAVEAPVPQAMTARKPKRERVTPSFLTGPLIFGAIVSLIWIALFGAAIVTRSWAIMGIGFFALIAWALIYLIWLLRIAHSVGGASMQAKCYMVPFYFLHFVFRESESPTLKAGTVAYIISIGMLLAAMLAIGKPQSTSLEDEVWYSRPASEAR